MEKNLQQEKHHVSEAYETSDGKIYVNGWVKWLVGSLWGLLLIILVTMAQNVIANDKESRSRDDNILKLVYANSLAIAEMKSIQDDLEEIKLILRRTTPYERELREEQNGH